MPMAKTRLGQIMIALALTGAWLISSVSGVSAADAFKMGVIDPQAVLEKSKAGKKALDGLKEYVSTRQKLLSRDEEELRNTEKTLKESASKLSEGEKKEKEAQFRTKIQEYQKRAQEFNQELQGKQKEQLLDAVERRRIIGAVNARRDDDDMIHVQAFCSASRSSAVAIGGE